jgi:exopolysaccharide production protein ExoQ
MGIKSEEIFNKVCWVFAAVILLNTILIPVLHIPSFGYTGIYPQKNGMGQVAVISFFFSIYAATKANGFKRILFCVFSILAVLLSVASHSKTSLALLILIPLFSWILVSVFRIQDSLKRVTTLIFCSILVAVIVSIGLIKSYDIYDLSYLIYHDRTFTGRTAIWKFAEHYIQQSPIIGYGYGSFWDVGNASRAIGTGFISTIFQAHNGYIDIVLELGYIGLFLAICYIVSIFLSITHIAIRDKITGILLLSCFLFVILNNTMESSLFRNYVPLWVVFLLCISASFEAKRWPSKAGQPDSASLA